jgi:hypothetical protein
MSKSKGRKNQGGAKVKANLDTLGIVHPNAAGIDIGSREIWVAVPPDRAGETVRCFGTFTPDLHALADWPVECQIDTVAMESTGVYWIPLFELLEAGGIRVFLVNARHVKHVPGRKSDIMDCQSPKGRRSALAAKAAQFGLADRLLPARRRDGEPADLLASPG